MHLQINEDQEMLVASFRRFFREQSSMARVREAEAAGHDPALWRHMAGMGLLAIRAPDAGIGIFDTVLVLEEAGRQLATGPVVETIVASRLLAQLDPNHPLLARAATGEAVLTLALRDADAERTQIVPGAGVAEAILILASDEIRLLRPQPHSPVPNHAGQPLSRLVLGGQADSGITLAAGSEAREKFLAAIEEWKLLTASYLTGLASEALDLAAAYAREREQFGRPIGSFQAVAHPLADRLADVVGARLLLWWAVRKIAEKADEAAAAVSMAWWWAAQASGTAVQRALHSFGGYGLTNEYDIQLYHRRAKAAALVLGDPADELLSAGERLWLQGKHPLPEAGAMPIEFGIGEDSAIAAETRKFFEENLTPEWRSKSHYAYDGHDWDLNHKLGKAGLLVPAWPRAHGGRDADRYEAAAALAQWEEFDVTSHAQSVSNMVGMVLIRFASETVKRDLLPRIAAGEIIMSLGYSEPGSGSDVFAARTRAVRTDDGWVINGQKMFTSGANLASHVLLLTRTNTDAPKTKGITLFIVPLDAPGVEIHPIHTFQEERTNTTFYADVLVPDSHRVGEVDGGAQVLGWALALEQGGAGFVGPHRRTVEAAVAWAKSALRNGGPAIEDPRVLERLARSHTRSKVSDLIYARSLWLQEKGSPDRAAGPMSKLFSSEAFLIDATDLFELAAPDTLLRGKHGLGFIEMSHRHATATTIYAGTSEVHRSQVAEHALGLPRSR